MSNQPWQTRTHAGATFAQAVAANPTKTLLAFDFDGTLAHIVQRPQDARMVKASADALETLADAGIQIAVISGRPVDTIVELADAHNRPGLKNAMIFGQYGAEHLNMATGTRHIPQPPEGIAQAKAELEAAIASHPGAHVEDKGLAIAAHVRETANPDEVFLQIEDDARNIASAHNLTVEPGRYVWELRGATVTKGDALAALIEEVQPEVIAFAGDDLGDLAAFAVLEEIRAAGNMPAGGATTAPPPATCIVISGSAEAPQLQDLADILCDGPDGVAKWLQALADAVTAPTPT